MKLDAEPGNTSEYESLLAQLPADERLRLLGKDFNLQRQLDEKRQYRLSIAELSPEKKLLLLEELRNRAALLQGRRRSPSLELPPTGEVAAPATPQVKSSQEGEPPVPSVAPTTHAHRFGGRATASGVNYETRVAAFLAVQMLSGTRCSVWSGVTGADITAITMQAPEPVDDIVVNLRGQPELSVFISAKERSNAIPLTDNSPTFTGTVAAFVCQYFKLSPEGRAGSRLLWALPATAGLPATRHLAEGLDELRMDAGGTALSEFMRGRQLKPRKALEALLIEARKAWDEQSGRSPTDDELRRFLRQVYVQVYEFEGGQGLERQAENYIRSHIAEDPEQAMRIWEKLEHFFARVDQRGVRVTPTSLRRILSAEGISLKSPPDYSQDVSLLRGLTERNLDRLKEHSTLPFGPAPGDSVPIPREEELTALVGAAKSGDFLITGEPGCGKSGLVYSLVGALQKENLPVVLLLAEDMTGGDWKGSANFPGLAHPLDEVLANWSDGKPAFLITDALDAVRDAETQRRARSLLRDVKTGGAGWTVIASVREFDLQYGRELRGLFPGAGVAGYASSRFPGVAHFHVPRLSQAQLDDLASARPEVRPFIERGAKTAKAGGVHGSPFYLRLAAELLNADMPPALLADWTNPALLFRRFWEARVQAGAGMEERQAALGTICQRMVETRRMIVSLTELPLEVLARKAVSELRSRGIFQVPASSYGATVGEDEIRFTHHLLHDYAIAQSLIPKSPLLFCDYALRQPLLPVFYRQSFLFALEELWDRDAHRAAFWESTLKLEGAPRLHALARILAPIIAARRVETLADLQPLLEAICSEPQSGSPSHKALLHLASGLQDVDEDLIRSGAEGWCAFIERLAGLVPTKRFVEWPLVHVLARLNVVGAAKDAAQRVSLNNAARGLLAYHVKQPVAKERQYPARIAIETVCWTFDTAPAESEHALLALMTPERLAQYPHHDLTDLAFNLKHLGPHGYGVVRRLFESAFGQEREPGEQEDSGSAIMNLQFQASDLWNMIRHALAEYYDSCNSENAALMTEAVCVAWNAIWRRRSGRRNQEEHLLATIQFRGTACSLIEDWSHIRGRGFDYDLNRILSHFEELLRRWAAAGDNARLSAALDRFAARNRTSLMWTVFLEAGAEYPASLGVMLAGVLDEPVFLTHPDYAYGGTALLGALHKTGAKAQRERLEQLILDLPMNVRLHKDDEHNSTPSWVEHARDRLLGALAEPNIILGAVRDLWHERQEAQPLPENRKPQGPQVISHTYSDTELMEHRGINLKEPANAKMFRLREELRTFLNRDDKKAQSPPIESHWPVIRECEHVLEIEGKSQPSMAQELWGYLVSACETIAVRAEWPKTDERWGLVRRILLKGAGDPNPSPTEDEDAKEDRWPSWGWPAPRLDAAAGLPFLAYRLGHADADITVALRRLCLDKSHPLRFNLAERLAVLFGPASDLMWELMDGVISNERRFSVLDSLLLALDRLWAKAPEEVMSRLRVITDRVMHGAPADNHVHEMLAHTHLFQFLRTGNPECEEFISRLIEECDSQRATGALGPQLHVCRDGGWLTAGEGAAPDSYADAVRARTWGFFRKLLSVAQARLKQHREERRRLHERGHPASDVLQPVQDALDRATRLVDGIAMQLYFASGAHEERTHAQEEPPAPVQLQRFWQDAAPLFRALADEPHPHTAHQIVQTLYHLLPCEPQEVFMLATRSILCSSEQARFQYEPLAVGDVVKLIQRALADYRDLFRSETGQESECLTALLEVLDLFVEAGWPEARQLTHRLEEIYR